MSDLEKSLDFYRKLGFRQVTATRGGEVILLRNHRGDELNLVTRSSDAGAGQIAQPVLFEVDALQRNLEQLQRWYPNAEITEDAVSRQIRLSDPDGNTIELWELMDSDRRSEHNIYHIVTESELIAGLNDYHYLPPDAERRFIRARARSAFISLACVRVAEDTKSLPLVIEMDKSRLSIEEQLTSESDFDSQRPIEESTYPHVNSPIPRQALIAVGESERTGADIPWPATFESLDALLSRPH